jgi:hypothetical protein
LIVFLNINGKIYCEECDSIGLAEELAKKWLKKAHKNFPFKDPPWSVTICEVKEKFRINS